MKRLHLCVEVIEWLPDWTFPMYLGVGDSGETRRQTRHLDVSIDIIYYNMRVWVRSLHIGSLSLRCLDLYRSVRTLLGPMCSYWRESTSTLRSWPNPLDGSLAMCWNGLLGLAQSCFLIILIVIYIYILYLCICVFTHVLECCVWHVSARCFFLLSIRGTLTNAIDARQRWCSIQNRSIRSLIQNTKITVYMHISLVCYFTRSNPRIIGGTKPRHNMHKQQQGQLTQIIPSIKAELPTKATSLALPPRLRMFLISLLKHGWVSREGDSLAEKPPQVSSFAIVAGI